jgi:tRNA pseudouridine55 synthase
MGRRRRDDADVHGLLNVCKARGYTSHDVVAVIRRTLGTRRVGHAGTLDPLAEGVLPVCVGRYTRLVDLIGATEKGYYAEVELGARTTTDDAEGEVVERRPVPTLTAEQLESALDRFRGEISQVPPAFSAIKVEGRRAYDLARRGDAPELKARPVTMYRLELVSWESPQLRLMVSCSKGTYIRSLARDLGEALGCGAHLTKLVRLWVGSFGLETAVSLDEIAAAASAGHLEAVVRSADEALSARPALLAPDDRAVDIGHGRPWPAAVRDMPVVAPSTPVTSPSAPLGPTRVYDTNGRLLGLAEYDPRRQLWQPRLGLAREPAPRENRSGGEEHDG